jgi:hypothetical protein
MGKIVKTSFGAVDGQALEKLQDSFDTTELLRAVDAIDQVRYRDDDLRQDMLDLHGMAHNLINQDYSSGTPRDESIGELAERLTGDILECIAHLEQAYAEPWVNAFRIASRRWGSSISASFCDK